MLLNLRELIGCPKRYCGSATQKAILYSIEICPFSENLPCEICQRLRSTNSVSSGLGLRGLAIGWKASHPSDFSVVPSASTSASCVTICEVIDFHHFSGSICHNSEYKTSSEYSLFLSSNNLLFQIIIFCARLLFSGLIVTPRRFSTSHLK